MWSMPAVAVMKVQARTQRISAMDGRMRGPALTLPWWPPVPGAGGLSQFITRNVLGRQADAGDGQERRGEHAGGDVPVPGDPFTDLVLVRSEQVLAVLVVLLDLPPHPCCADEFSGRCAQAGVGQEVLDVGGLGDRSAHQQRVLLTVGRDLLFHGDRDGGPVVGPLALRTVTARAAFEIGGL
jgi:hypothetical protein